jgi:hypothetical protein
VSWPHLFQSLPLHCRRFRAQACPQPIPNNIYSWCNVFNNLRNVIFQVLTAAKMQVTAFCNTSAYSWSRPTFQKCVLPPSSGWRLIAQTTETVRTIETSVYCNETTQRYIPERCYLQLIKQPITSYSQICSQLVYKVSYHGCTTVNGVKFKVYLCLDVETLTLWIRSSSK